MSAHKYQGEQELQPLVTIGVIHTPFSQPSGMPVQGAFADDVEGEVEIDPAYEEGLADLEGFSRIVLLYAFHRSSGYRLTVTPYLDPNPRGLFATRAPRRPNPIGMTVVRLVEVTGCRLRIRGVDMLDGTPLLDIKPHIPFFDCREGGEVGWLEPHLQELERRGAALADARFHRESDGEDRG
jgi:tRNA-Thr(GGU) m(6)t(6)A37 methyltransferase TsaA